MTIREHKVSFAGYPVEQWNAGPLKAGTAYRISIDFNDPESWPDKLARFVRTPGSDQVQAVIVGAAWDDQTSMFHNVEMFVQALVQQRQGLPNVHALFMPDITFEESEISWITQTDVSPLLEAYPKLTHFGTRGSNDLRFGRPRHTALQSLVLESGGMPQIALEQLLLAELPQLIDFEVWTGTAEYGWNGTLNDLLPFIRGDAFPNLKRLGICNCEMTDAVVNALVESPFYNRLEHLDLSRGTLSDTGATLLLNHPATYKLKSLDVRHHFCSPPIEAQLYGLAGDGVKIMIDTAQGLRDWGDMDGRFIAVSE